MCDAAGTSTTGLRSAALVALLYCSGLRVSEALALRPHHIQEREGSTIIQVEHGKGGRAGWSVLMPDRGQLAAWMERRATFDLPPDAPLFCSTSRSTLGNRMYRSGVQRVIRTLGAKAGITKRCHPHGLRHTHSVHLYSAGAPQSAIQDQLRHSDPETTRRYLRDLGCIDSRRVLAGLSWS
jgi:integrase/recombinase XerC